MSARRLAVVCRRVPAAVARHASTSTAYLYIITECLCARAALQSCVAGCPRRWHVTRPPRQRTCISSPSACERALLAVVCRRVPAAVARHASASTAYLYIITECLCACAALQSCVAGCPRRWHVTRPPRQRTCISSLSACERALLAVVCRRVPAAGTRHASASTAYLYIITECLCARAALQSCVAGCPRRWHVTRPPRQRTCISSLSACERALLAVVCRRVPAAVARHASASTAYLYIITECLCACAALQSCVAGCPRRWRVTRPPRQRTCISSPSACVRAPPCSRVSPGARGGGTSRVRLDSVPVYHHRVPVCVRRLAVVCRRVPAAVARHASASTAYLYIITECLCARAALQSCVAGCPRRWHVTRPPRQRTCISSLSACVRAPPCSRVSPGARGGDTSRVRLDSVPVYHHRVPVCARRLAVVCRRVPAAVARHASASTAYLYIITECL